MRLARIAVVAGVWTFLVAAFVRAETPADPIRLVPSDSDVLLEVRNPRLLVETGLNLKTVQELQKLDAVSEFFQSNSYKRFYQLLAYFEKELGAKWPEALDQVAGGGVALAIKFGPDPAPALLVIQGKDEKKVTKFFSLALSVYEQGTGDEAKDKLQHKDYHKIDTVQMGNDLHAAQAGSAILVSNKAEGLQRALDLYRDADTKSLANQSTVNDARKLLPENCLVRLWLNLDKAKELPDVKPLFTSPPGDPGQTTLFGGWLDVARRSSFLCAGIYPKDLNKFALTIRMPAGREGMADFMAVHIPPPGKNATRPLLEPKNVIFSTSFYLDLPMFYEKRAKLYPEDVVKGIDDGDKQLAKFLPEAKISTLLSQTSPYHRFVAVAQDDFGYKQKSRQAIPAFAYILELSDPEPFAKSMNTLLRAVALGAGAQAKLKLVEEKHGECKIVGYRFPDDGKVEGDADYARFSYSPCFVKVGNQFVVSSTMELCHELIDLLEAEAKKDKHEASNSAIRSRVYAKGGVAFGRNYSDVLVTQAVLGQALDSATARKQVDAFLAWAEKLGTIDIESVYSEKDWRMEFELKLK